AVQYDKFDKNIKLNTVIKKSYDTESKTWNENYFFAETQEFLSKEEARKVLHKVKSSRALKEKDFTTYEKLTLESYKDYSTASSEEMNSAAWNFFENVNSQTSHETALAWAQESVNKNQNHTNTDTLANLYNKIGDKKNAKIWAEKSIELAKSTGQDYSDTEKLLKTL